MRAFKVLLLTPFVGLCLNAQTGFDPRESDRERGGYKGLVRIVRTETTKISDAEGQSAEGPRVLVSTSAFDRQGNATEKESYNPNGARQSKIGWATTYDEKGRESAKVFLNAEGTPTARSVSTYDGRGRLSELTFYGGSSGSVNHHETFLYDDRGNLVQENHRNPDGTSRTSISYTYDARANLTEVKYVSPSGVVEQRSVITYDERGRQTSFTAYDEGGNQSLKFTSGYDAKGNRTEYMVFGRDGSLRRKETYSYEFDAGGNWVVRREVKEIFENGKAQTERWVSYRAITYY